MINISVKKGIRDIGIDAIVAIMKELEQLHRKKVFHPVYLKRVLSRPIRSHLFLKRKRDIRLKGCMVADESQQFKSADFDTSSPTVSTEV
jgi:hypothetical protein